MCYWILESSRDEHGYIPVAVCEGVPGYAPMTGNGPFAAPWYWGTEIGKAMAICARANADLGLSEDDVRAIVASSMGADPSRQMG